MKFLNKTIFNPLRQQPNRIQCLSTTTKSWKEYDFHATIRIPGSSKKAIDLHNIWLRHHCQCEKCYNPKTYQKMQIPSHLPPLSQIKDLSTSAKANSVRITWSDDHASIFDIDWLTKVRSTMDHLPQTLGSKYSCNNFAKTESPTTDPLKNSGVEYSDFMSQNSSVAKLLANIVQNGYGLVTNAPPDYNSTKEVVLRISHPQNTIFGDFSEWTSNLTQADTAYTSDTVHLHTDTSYFTEPAGLQMFHCLRHDGDGGINCLVDGFQVAKRVFESEEHGYDLLSRILVPSQYLDKGRHAFYSVDTTFKHDPLTGMLQRVRYNPHDMATLDTIPFDKMAGFYEALVHLSDQIENSPSYIKLVPGMIIFLDNWRMLHGRSAFTGLRHLCGAYISRSDWLSKARVLGVEL